MKIYVASSWRNNTQPVVVKALREDGHEVYDFRDHGFSWSQIDPEWKCWTPKQYVEALEHPLATHGCGRDLAAMVTADACVMVQPCGVSAALELGWCIGQGKRCAVLLQEGPRFEPELMFALAHLVTDDLAKVREFLR